MTSTAQKPEVGVQERGEESAAVHGLFGRDMIYLAFWGLQIVLAAALTPATTRLMPKSAFGQASAAIAVMQLLNCLFSFSLYTAVQRAHAGEDGERHARRLVALAIGLAAITGSLAYATGRWWSPLFRLGPFPPAIRYAVLWAVMSAITGPALGLLRSQDRLKGFVAASFAQSVVAQTLALGLVVLVRATASSYMLGQLLGEIATAVIALSIARPLLPRLRHARVLAGALRFSSALVPAAIASFLIEASDRIIIHGDLGAGAVGRYAVARNIGSFAMVLLQLVSFVWMPRLFAMKNAAARRNVLATSRDALYGLVVTFAIAIAAASPLLLRLWAPPSYEPHTLLLITALIAAGALPVADSLIYQQVLILQGRTRAVGTAALAMALLNLGLNLLLVPVLGINGSAGIACVCYALGALRWRWLAGNAGPPTNPRALLLALGGVAVCIASSAVSTEGIALALRLLVALLAAMAFAVQLGKLVRPSWRHDLREQLFRRSLRIQFEWGSDSHRL